MESNMAHGPIYFNCFPYLELSCIDDMTIHKALTLNVQTKVNAKCLLKSPKGKTLLFQANEEHSSTMTPEEIPWESLTHSNTWNFTQLALPKPIQNRKPLFIMQDDKGNVTIQFPKREK
ncbi:hypothetical protein AAG906_018917 [Vitis piasezkii]